MVEFFHSLFHKCISKLFHIHFSMSLTCKLSRILFSSSSELVSCFISCLESTSITVSIYTNTKTCTRAGIVSVWGTHSPMLALQHFHRGPQVPQLVPDFLKRRGGQRWVPQLWGGAQTRGGRRGNGAMAGVWQGQGRGLGGQWYFTVGYLTKIQITN